MGPHFSPLMRGCIINVSRAQWSIPETVIQLERCHPFSTSAPYQASSQAMQRKHKDPYALAQARQRKAANLARQAVLQSQRDATLGDPVRGHNTPFIESLRTANPEVVRPGQEAISKNTAAEDSTKSPPGPEASRETHIDHLLYQSELRKSLETSHLLTQPTSSADRSSADPGRENDDAREHQQLHFNAEAAMNRIFSLSNSSAVDRKRTNVHRCVQTFGRHETSKFLAPRPPSNVPRNSSSPRQPEKTPRAGPDTGSSEVQVAILTTKIQALADHLDGPGRKDKVNKRNLRLLVHRRQKLLTYLRRKDRGGERWQHVMRTLGLTDASWKGEISL